MDTLIVPGLDDGHPDPWQSHWMQRRPGFRRVVPPASAEQDLNRWAAAVAMAIDGFRTAPMVVAHGFGVLATLRATFMFERRLAGAMLVGPADPDRYAALARLPATPLPYPSLLVICRDDPWIKVTKAGALATRWGSRFVVIGRSDEASDASQGPWPQGDRLLRTFAAELASREVEHAA